MATTTRQPECSATRTLYVALELGQATWRLAMTTAYEEPARQYRVPAGRVDLVLEKVARARQHWGLTAAAPVVSCYEAGRDAFWLHRSLTAQGVRNVVVDATSIPRDQRAKWVKTDRLDAGRLLRGLVAWAERDTPLRVVRVPSVAEEDARQPARELATLKQQRTAITNRITGLLLTQGVRGVRVRQLEPAAVATLRTWDGTPMPPALAARVTRDCEALEAVTARTVAVERARRQALAARATPATCQMAQLQRLRGIGVNGAEGLVVEFFAWRAFRNGRQVGALAGLTPTPYQSGSADRDQGISKAGNKHVRVMAIELAWCWLRFQPSSVLSRWYQTRFGAGSRRQRRIGIVALARKLLVVLWRYLDAGVIPDGAVVSPTA